VRISDIKAALEAERDHCKVGIAFRVTTARREGATVVVGVDTIKGRRSTAIDEALEGSRAVWGENFEGHGKVFVVSPDTAELVLDHAHGALPGAEQPIRLFPRDFLTPLIDLWSDPARARKANDLLKGQPLARTPAEKPLPLAMQSLRDRQVEAVQASLQRSALIIGPPGTGKTYTVGATLAYLLCRFPNARVILTGPTNVAVDTALVSADEWLLRLGRPDLRATMKRVGSRFDTRRYAGREHLLAPGLYEAAVKLSLLEDEEPPKSSIERYVAWKKRVEEARGALTVDFVALARDTRVLALTTTSAFLHFDALSMARAWHVVVCDEASQVTMPAALMVGTLATQAIFAGDPNQLAPVVQCKAAAPLLSRTAFDVLTQARTVRLNEQSRMAPGICDVISHAFYGNDLIVCRKAARDTQWHRERSPWFVNGRPVPPILFDNRAGDHDWSAKYNGWIRYGSAKVVQALVSELLGSYAEPQDILVLTPFRAQRALIRAMFKHDTLRAVRVSTVHRAQGTECGIVVFDPVDAGGTFLNCDDGKRLINVALSRAKAHAAIMINRTDLNNRWLREMHARARERWHTAGDFAQPFTIRVPS
jgi:hypothetical protein